MLETEAAKEKYLPPVCNAEGHPAIAISELESEPDVTSTNTHVKRAHDGELY